MSYIGPCFRIAALILTIALVVPVAVRLYFFDNEWYATAQEAANNVDLSGKIIIVTGSNTGIGLPTARVLLDHGATVIMACRNMDKARAAKATIAQQLLDGKNMTKYKYSSMRIQFIVKKLHIINLDLGSFKSIDTFVETFQKKYNKLNYLILNAGLSKQSFELTADGIEQTFGVNHVGNHYLTMQLTPLLIKTANNETEKNGISRVISVASYAHQMAHNPISEMLSEGAIQNESNFNANFGTYAFSKACNILFAKEYNERYSKDNVYAVSLHPGTIATELTREHNIFLQFVYNYVISPWILKTLDQGAATTIKTVSITDEEFKHNGGSYWSDCNVTSVREDLFPKGVAVFNMPQKLLWELTEDMIKKYK